MNDDELKELVSQCLRDFHERRLERARNLTLKAVLRRKNPYLFRALGVESPSEIIERLLEDHLSSSDETIFGETFFKPIARYVSEGEPADYPGVDFQIENNGNCKVVKVVSGPNVQNSSQKRKQADDFQEAKRILTDAGQNHVAALLGHAYGKYRTEDKEGQSYRDRSGQDFWEELTGAKDFYQRLMVVMGDESKRQKTLFERSKMMLAKLFTAEFELEFCHPDGQIDWARLLEFVSQSKMPALE